ncbi:HIT domain-containing protein [Gottfriedia solisilvae]|uniref:HIT domain-containing protein n=1 Tax=Gottfriedia solisilvae TaxID=1516104 RepID=UPI000B44E7D7|nr:HIT domain-containing protein [Gottfriedia solisilvae]
MGIDFYCEEVLSGKTKVNIVHETERVLAYHHTKPFYPIHIVVIPKKHISSLLTIEEEDQDLLLEMLSVIKIVADKVNSDAGACRVSTNLGNYQDSKHLHWHVASGNPL